MHWSYEIVPVGGHHRLAGASFEAPDLEAAKHHVETVYEPTVSKDADLDVRLLDGSGQEVWRGAYVGPKP
ncbi:MAG: hypothetical protein JO007_00165 [Alphaproteobacteria bacterium]|nr:hypothetical protein [Alphaproteobacteria bacterium]